MKALFYREKGRFELSETEIPKIKNPDGVLIKVQRSGICGTDIQIYLGNHPATPNTILGHEYCGIVEEVGGAVKHVQPGDHVAIDPNIKCGVCNYCRTNRENQCELLDQGRTLGIFLDGGFAPYNVAPQSAVYQIPDNMDFDVAALVEPVSCVINALKIAEIQPENNVLILGAGLIGYLFSCLVKNMAGFTIVTEVDESRIERIKKVVPCVCNPKEENVLDVIRSETRFEKVDIVIDTTGVMLENALSCVAKGGKILIFGMNSSYSANIRTYDITRNEIKILGSYIANNTFIPAINILYNEKINAKNYIFQVLPLSDIFKAFELLGLDLQTGKRFESQALKILIDPQR